MSVSGCLTSDLWNQRVPVIIEDTAEPGPGVFVEVIDVSNHFCLEGDQVDVADQVQKTAIVFVGNGIVPTFKEVS